VHRGDIDDIEGSFTGNLQIADDERLGIDLTIDRTAKQLSESLRIDVCLVENGLGLVGTRALLVKAAS
jgi:hypothetical protein